MRRLPSLPRILLLCWTAYAVLYFGRVNFPVALPDLEAGLSLDKLQLGLVGSCFFWFYGAGQLLNGRAGDRVSVRLYVLVALLATAAANFFFGGATELGWLCLFWGLNGLAQSMVWGPMVKLIGDWTAPRQRNRAITLVSTSMVGGYLAAWGLSGLIIERWSVAWVFWIPSVVLAAVGLLWFWGVRDLPAPRTTEPAPETAREAPASLGSLWKPAGMTGLLVLCVLQAVVKDGLTLWAPSYFREVHGLDPAAAAGVLLLVPVVGFAGILLGGWLNSRLGHREYRASAWLFAAGLGCLAVLATAGAGHVGIAAASLAGTAACLFGANTLLLGVLPLRFLGRGRVSTVTGLLDATAYFASGIAAVAAGPVIDGGGWGALLGLWAVLLALGAGLLFVRREVTL